MDFILDTLGKVGFDWRMGLFHLVNFFIVFWILKKYMFAPITNAINERQKNAKQAVQNFEKSKTELGMAERKARELIDDAKGEANSIVEKSYDEAAKQGEIMKDKAKTEIEGLVHQAKKSIASEKAAMKEELKKETVELVVATTEKVLGGTMQAKDHKAFIEGSLKSVE